MKNCRVDFKRFMTLTTVSLLILITCACTKPIEPATSGQVSLDVTDYDMEIDLFPTDKVQPEEESIKGTCTIKFINKGDGPISRIPLLLYRLLDVKTVSGIQGRELRFSQKVVKMEDFSPVWQVNRAEVELSGQLQPGEEGSFTVAYGGFIYGSPEVFPYTKDHIGADYTLLRNDIFAYPRILENSWDHLIANVSDTYNFRVRISAPRKFLVACGGRITGQEKTEERNIFSFEGYLPDWRIDIAAAEFDLLTDQSQTFRIYHFTDHEDAAGPILTGLKDSLNIYSGWIGNLKSDRSFTVIEIPGGYGGQASANSILLPAELFAGERDLNSIYHEVAHMWEVPSLDEQPSRWLSEGFANYFMALVLREMHGREEFTRNLEGFRNQFRSQCISDPQLSTTPISEYGSTGKSQASYNKGALALHVLHETLGDPVFKNTFQDYYDTFHEKGATLEEFRTVAEKVSGRKLDQFFNEWIYGTESSNLLLGELSLEEIAERYR